MKNFVKSRMPGPGKKTDGDRRDNPSSETHRQTGSREGKRETLTALVPDHRQGQEEMSYRIPPQRNQAKEPEESIVPPCLAIFTGTFSGFWLAGADGGTGRENILSESLISFYL